MTTPDAVHDSFEGQLFDALGQPDHDAYPDLESLLVLVRDLRAERYQLLRRLTPDPALPLPDGYEEELIASLAEHGWSAEWESQEPNASPARYVRGCLSWTYGAMALSRHPSLELSIHGLSGVWTAVDLLATPATEVREKMAAFATSCLTKDAPYFAAALAEAEVVTDRAQGAKGYDAAHDDQAESGELAEIERLDRLDANGPR